ncbi:hypothetical protein A2U01_0112876, partial [Trifolium medium]|nr:hypothetical protein [Trifolium medium]
AARAGATRRAVVLRQFFFWYQHDTQLGLARRASLPCLVLFSSSVGAEHAGSLRGAQVC